MSPATPTSDPAQARVRRDGPGKATGKIVEVEDEAEHKTVEVWLE